MESAILGELFVAGSSLALGLEWEEKLWSDRGWQQAQNSPFLEMRRRHRRTKPSSLMLLDILPWEASANQNHLVTSELLVLQSQKVFPGVEEVVVFFSLEGMSCLAELALGSGINSSAVSHMKITPERITVFTIFQLKGGNCSLELQTSTPCVWWDKSRWLLLPTDQPRENPCNLPEVVISKTLTILA